MIWNDFQENFKSRLCNNAVFIIFVCFYYVVETTNTIFSYPITFSLLHLIKPKISLYLRKLPKNQLTVSFKIGVKMKTNIIRLTCKSCNQNQYCRVILIFHNYQNYMTDTIFDSHLNEYKFFIEFFLFSRMKPFSSLTVHPNDSIFILNNNKKYCLMQGM